MNIFSSVEHRNIIKKIKAILEKKYIPSEAEKQIASVCIEDLVYLAFDQTDPNKLSTSDRYRIASSREWLETIFERSWETLKIGLKEKNHKELSWYKKGIINYFILTKSSAIMCI
jgi:hypothetical protein